MKATFIVGLLFITLTAFAKGEKKVHIHIYPSYNNKPIVLDDMYYHNPNGDSILFETFRCYISGIAFYLNDSLVLEEKNSYHLVDASDDKTLNIVIHPSEDIVFNNVRFNLGIDSAMNMVGVMGGDLDPANGMYWTWQSGYINLKLEGKSNRCATRGNKFHFHLGGFSAPNNALQKIRVVTNTSDIQIAIAIDKFLDKVDITKQNSVMIPGAEAVDLSKKIARSVIIQE